MKTNYVHIFIQEVYHLAIRDIMHVLEGDIAFVF
jgi:hypothetical protein